MHLPHANCLTWQGWGVHIRMLCDVTTVFTSCPSWMWWQCMGNSMWWQYMGNSCKNSWILMSWLGLSLAAHLVILGHLFCLDSLHHMH